jgi:hypothetical protein
MKFLGNSKIAIRAGLTLGILHFCLMLLFLINIYRDTSDGQWFMVWLLPYYVDFPISAIFERLIWYITINVEFLPPYFCGLGHLIAGSIWFFYIPIIINMCINRIATSKTSRILVGILSLLPMLTSWTYLLLEEWGNVYCDSFNKYTGYDLTSCMEYGLAVLYIVLLILAYNSNGSKKRQILWLLFLMPYVFWQPCVCLWYSLVGKFELFEWHIILIDLSHKIQLYTCPILIGSVFLIYQHLKRMGTKAQKEF